MRFERTDIDGVVVVEIDEIRDERGFFARTFCAREFAEAGLETTFVQANVGVNDRRGTLRGLHFQTALHAEVKLVRCVRGAVWDVALDLRPDSPTFGRSYGMELSADNRRSLHVPLGCAHGYLTLADDSELHYLTSAFYVAGASTGVRYDDPAFGIEWPAEIELVSERDREWPLWETRGEVRR